MDAENCMGSSGCSPDKLIIASRSPSISVVTGAGKPTGGTPPMAKPVCSRTKSGSARRMGSLHHLKLYEGRSTRLLPLTRIRIGFLVSFPRKISDLTIAPTEQPTAWAASGAVRVECRQFNHLTGNIQFQESVCNFLRARAELWIVHHSPILYG